VNATANLAALALGIDWGQLPEAIRRKVKWALLDALACGVAGSGSEIARRFRRALGLPKPGEALLLGQAERTTALMACYYNALAINALDYDDQAPTGGHPGACVVAATLAAAERFGGSGTQLLSALAAGYEVAMRVQAAIRPSSKQYRRAHGNGTPLAFGAAAAVGRLLGFDSRDMRRAFGHAGPLSPVPHANKFGWEEEELSWAKDNTAWPAEAGFRAALLVGAGVPASATIFDGDAGFWRMAASDRFDEQLFEDHHTFHLQRLAFKTYPCCRWLHPMLDGLRELQHAYHLTPENISSITVHSTRTVARKLDIRRPGSMVDSQFSAPYVLAMQLLAIPHEWWWRSEHRQAPTVTKLMNCITLREDPALSDRYYQSGRSSNHMPARVIVHLRTGSQVEGYCDHASGSADHPQALLERLLSKWRSLLGERYSPEGVSALMDIVEKLDSETHSSTLTANLAAMLDSNPAPTKR